VARDTDNNKLHNKKTPQPTKGQRYDGLKQKIIFQTWWKEKITWIEASGRLILVVPFNKALFFLFFVVVANSGYFTVFTPHIYFIILISMIAGTCNLIEIRLPKIRKEKITWIEASGRLINPAI
jgi:hypothetical protein